MTDVTIPGQIREHNTNPEAHKHIVEEIKSDIEALREDVGKLKAAVAAMEAKK